MLLKLHYGTAVSGDQCFGRPDLEARLLRQLESTNGVKMFGLRRIGKSTLTKYVIAQLEKDGRPYAFFDGQGLNSLSDFLTRWLHAMPQQVNLFDKALAVVGNSPAKGVLEALTKGTQFDEATLDAYWQAVSDAISKASAEGTPPILIIDEFSMFMSNLIKKHGPETADRLLASMREWRTAGVRMLLTGSIGMQALAREHSLNHDHLNDLEHFSIPELTEAEAREFVRQGTDARTWTDAHTDEFLKQTGVYYPCFLVKGLLEVGAGLQPQDFGAKFSQHVRPHLHADFFKQFDRRFKAYDALPDDRRKELILPALAAIMSADAPVPQATLPRAEKFDSSDLKEAMDMLVEDGFLDFTSDADFESHWYPASRLARIWWKRSGLK